MTDVLCFGEDSGHEQVISSLLKRLSVDEGVPFTLTWRSATHGHGRVVSELKSLLRDIRKEKGDFPDLIVVATDANCVGYGRRRRDITDLTDKIPGIRVVCALPDPHIERWLLIDSAAFKSVWASDVRRPIKNANGTVINGFCGKQCGRRGFLPPLAGLSMPRTSSMPWTWTAPGVTILRSDIFWTNSGPSSGNGECDEHMRSRSPQRRPGVSPPAYHPLAYHPPADRF